jgi:predicted membrane chloride channel (bestrophin family)
LLVFRTNSAYDRWWEGRKVWGSVLNNSRNLSLKLSSILVHEKDKLEIKYLITNYVFAFKNHLYIHYTEFFVISYYIISQLFYNTLIQSKFQNHNPRHKIP